MTTVAKILDEQIRSLEGSRAGVQRAVIAERGIHIASERYVEAVIAIDATEAIEAGFVEINEPGGHIRVVTRVDINFPQTVVEIGRILEALELADDFLDCVLTPL